MSHSKPTVLLCIGGGIAAYKSATLCSKLVQDDIDVRVAMTDAAGQFIGAAALSALSGRHVATSCFDSRYPLGAHIELASGADLMIVAPATADLMAKFVCGIADDLVTTLYLQATCPVMIAPAMSSAMWDKPSVQRNVAQLGQDGCELVGPESGWLSCRLRGDGRMSEPGTIADAIRAKLGIGDRN